MSNSLDTSIDQFLVASIAVRLALQRWQKGGVSRLSFCVQPWCSQMQIIASSLMTQTGVAQNGDCTSLLSTAALPLFLNPVMEARGHVPQGLPGNTGIPPSSNGIPLRDNRKNAGVLQKLSCELQHNPKGQGYLRNLNYPSQSSELIFSCLRYNSREHSTEPFTGRIEHFRARVWDHCSKQNARDVA